MKDLYSPFIWGSWQEQVKETFSKASPILAKFPSRDRGFVLYLLKEQTVIAMNWPDPHQRKIEKNWVTMCRAIDRFVKTTSKASKELEEDMQNRRTAVEAEGVTVTYWPKVGDAKPSPELVNALKPYAEMFALPGYEQALERKSGGRPSSLSDAVAWAMKEYFKEKLGSPRWTLVGQLLSCTPPMKGFSMEGGKIRQRLVRRQKEDRRRVRVDLSSNALGRTRPTIVEEAYGFKRTYTQWVKAGAKGPCPSFLHPSIFRDPALDTSLSEESFTRIAEDLHKKYQ